MNMINILMSKIIRVNYISSNIQMEIKRGDTEIVSPQNMQ